jgi:hypothetical protein
MLYNMRLGLRRTSHDGFDRTREAPDPSVPNSYSPSNSVILDRSRACHLLPLCPCGVYSVLQWDMPDRDRPMLFRPLSKFPTLRRTLAAIGFVAAVICFAWGLGYAAFAIALALSCMLHRGRPPAPAPNTSSRKNVSDGAWIRDPTNLTSPYGDYDPPSQS